MLVLSVGEGKYKKLGVDLHEHLGFLVIFILF